MDGKDGVDGKDGTDGQSVVYSTQSWDILSNGDRPADCYISPDTCTPKAKSGDLIITADGILGRVAYAMSVSNYWRCEFIVSLKGADGKDGAGIPSITDHSTETTPFLDINFGKANEIRKAFFEQSLLLGKTHYGDGFIQNEDGKRATMPELVEAAERLSTERQLNELYNMVDVKFGYYGKTGAERHEIKCNALYIVFATNSDLKICKADGTEVVTGAQQLFIMTTPYGGVKSGSVFVGMGMYIYKSSFSITNLKIPVDGIQVELDDGSYITAGSASTNIYVSQMVKG